MASPLGRVQRVLRTQRAYGVGRTRDRANVGAILRPEQARFSRLYWTTQATNAAGRALYDKMAEHRGFIVYSRKL